MSEYTLPVPKAAPAAASAKKVALTDATTVYELYRVRFRGREREGDGGQGRGENGRVGGRARQPVRQCAQCRPILKRPIEARASLAGRVPAVFAC